MRALITASSLLFTLTACGQKPSPPKKTPKPEPATAATPESELETEPLPEGVRTKIANQSGPCARTLCVAGPGELGDAPNRDLNELCRRAPGVVQRCEGERCVSVWTLEQWRQGFDALIASLDQNADGRIDEGDGSCRLGAAGWSEGAVVAAEDLPRALGEDARVSEARAVVDRLVAIAPWAPEREQLAVAAEVRKAWIYRHSQTPAGDCSRTYEDGPRLSPPPVCGERTQCWDYDFSHASELAFLSRRGARSASEIGHCNIVAVLAKIGLDNLARGIEAPAEHVPPYSNGERGGRVSEGPRQPDPPKLLDNPPEPD